MMPAPTVRRADFLMALAYATDLATGHSRDFALRSCVLAMRLADVARPRRRHAPQRLSPGAASLHRLQRRHPSAGVGVGRRDRASPGASAHRHGQQVGARRDLRPRHHAHLRRTRRPTELAKAVRARPCRGAAGERPDPVRALRGRAADRGADRPVRTRSARISARSTSAGTDTGLPRGLSGEAVKFPVRLVTLAQDAIALTEAHGFETMNAMIAKRARRRLRAGARRSFPRAMPSGCSRGSTGPSTARRSWRSSPRRTRCSTRRLARRPIWRSPT